MARAKQLAKARKKQKNYLRLTNSLDTGGNDPLSTLPGVAQEHNGVRNKIQRYKKK